MRSLVYGLMTLSVLTIVSVLMLIILGYSFNRQDGRLEQGGLLQFASTPSGATVTLDGMQTSSRTPSKASVEAKNHHVQMDLRGYRSWQKNITVQAGGIGWLSYARFVPTDVKVETMRTFPKLAASLASVDRKWIVIQEDAAVNSFVLANIESDTPKYASIAIPESILTQAPTQSFTISAWSRNDDRLLVKRTYDGDKVEWISVNRQNPSESVNLTSSFGIAAVDMQFGERNGSDVFVLTDEGLVRRLDVGSKTLSEPLAENVSEYSVYDQNTLVYVTKPDGKEMNQRHVGYRTDDMDVAQTIFSYPAQTQNIHAALGEYYGKKYVAVTHDMVMKVFVGTLPRDETKASLRELTSSTLAVAPARLTIGENGRLAVAELPDGYVTFDIELEKTDVTAFSKPATVVRPLQWIDSYIVANDRGGIARFYEFDGANQQDVMSVVEGQAISLTGNEKFLYGLSATSDGFALTRARMILAN